MRHVFATCSPKTPGADSTAPHACSNIVMCKKMVKTQPSPMDGNVNGAPYTVLVSSKRGPPSGCALTFLVLGRALLLLGSHSVLAWSLLLST